MSKPTLDDYRQWGKTSGGDQHRIFVALRRERPDLPFVWTAVRGLRLKPKDPAFSDWKVFTYRDGPAVFAVDEQTGITLAVAPTVPRIVRALNEALADVRPAELRADLLAQLDSINPGPMPKAELKP